MERSDVQAALEARRELGPAYDDDIVDSLLKKLDERRPAQQARAPHGSMTPLALGSILLGVGATGAANGSVVVAVVAWIAIVLVNVAVAFRHRF